MPKTPKNTRSPRKAMTSGPNGAPRRHGTPCTNLASRQNTAIHAGPASRNGAQRADADGRNETHCTNVASRQQDTAIHAGPASRNGAQRADADGRNGAPNAGTGTGNGAQRADAASCNDGALAAWIAKYSPVEKEILAAAERRRNARFERRAQRVKAFGDLCEASEGLAVVWRRHDFPEKEMLKYADGDIWYLYKMMPFLRRKATKAVDALRHQYERPLYYEQERARRLALAADRRRIRDRRTANPCPSREQFLDAWLHRGDSNEARLRLGSLLQDLECYVDNSLRMDDRGRIIGRNSGLKGWIQENVPAFMLKYSTLIRYKAAAKKMRQIVELADPVPLDRVFTPVERAAEQGNDGNATTVRTKLNRGREETMGAGGKGVGAPGGTGNGADGMPSMEIVRARAVYLEVMNGVGTGRGVLFARIDALLNPLNIDGTNLLNGWREKYRDAITTGTQKRWWQRLFANKKATRTA